MAAFTLFGQQAVTDAMVVDANAYTLGVQFSVSQPCRLAALWFYSPSGAGALPQTVGIYTVSNQTLVHSETPTWSGAVGTGWVQALFTTPPTLASNTAYEAVVLQTASTSWYAEHNLYWSTGAGSAGFTNGPLSAPGSSSATVGQDLFTRGATLAYPSNTYNSSNYWVDVEVAPIYSWFDTAGGGTLTPSLTTNGGGYYEFGYFSWSSAIQLTHPFGVTASGYELAGYKFWWDGANAVTLYDMCLWQCVGGSWSVVASSDVLGPSLTPGWNLLSLNTPIPLVNGALYAICTDQTGGFYDAGNFYTDYPNGITNGPLTLFGPSNIPQSQTNAGAFGEDAGTSAAALSSFPSNMYAQNGYPIDVLVQVAASGSLPSVLTTRLPGATTGTAYTESLAGNGGTGPYTWSLNSGNLPAGLSLSSSGIISGTPTTVGTVDFTVQLTDANNNIATAALNISVSSITFNVGAVSDSGGTTLTSDSITIPNGVKGGDVMLLMVTAVTPLSTQSAITLSATGTTFTQLSTTQYATSGGYSVNGAIYYAVAAGAMGSASSDAGATITASSADNTYWAFAISTYSGASPTIDCSGGTAVTGTVGVTLPTENTTHDGDWAVYFGGGAVEGSAVPVGPSGSTVRERSPGNSAVYAAIYDSNNSVGPASTTIGGGVVTNSSSSGNNWWAAFTIGLSSAATVTINTTSFAVIPTNVPILKFVAAEGGRTPYTWSVTSGSLPPGISLTASGSQAGTLKGSATTAGTYPITLEVTDANAKTATASFSLDVINAPLTPTSPATDGNGVITWQVTSLINLDDNESIRVLNPTAPDTRYPHGFLFTLPVAGGTDDTSYGNGLDTIRTLGLHNTYNLTVIEASTGGYWLADNPANPYDAQESYMVQVATWAKQTYATTGSEKNYLIGFSRTGLGSQGLFFHHPDIFYGVASWDFPAMMTAYDGTDPVFGTVGGGPAGSYGTADNFTSNYQLSSANLARWTEGMNFGAVNRVWIGGYVAFTNDAQSYDPVLTTANILHTTAIVSASIHNWAPTPGWVAPALATLVKPLPPSTMLMASCP